LESLTLASLNLDEETMLSLLHLSTLTALDPHIIQPNAWPLLPQLSLLRRVRINPSMSLTPTLLSSLCDSLSRCSMLEDLTLRTMHCETNDGAPLDAEGQRVGLAALLSSVPNLRRLRVNCSMDALLPLLPSHLPLLEHLTLSGRGSYGVDYFARVAHPNIRQLELGPIGGQLPSDSQLRACLHSERLPKLERCVRVGRVE